MILSVSLYLGGRKRLIGVDSRFINKKVIYSLCKIFIILYRELFFDHRYQLNFKQFDYLFLPEGEGLKAKLAYAFT